MKKHLPVIITGVFMLAVLGAAAGTQSTPPATTPGAATARAASNEPVQATVYSDGIAEILRMSDAGVSKDVIKVYVECSSIAYNPTASDLIALKERGLPDEISTALVKRGAEVRGQNSQAIATVAGPAPAPATQVDAAGNTTALVSVMNATGQPYLDTEGHDYWFYHYAYPRTLSYAYQRLSPYAAGYPAYYPATPFGFNQPFGVTFSTGYYPRFGGPGYGGRPFSRGMR